MVHEPPSDAPVTTLVPVSRADAATLLQVLARIERGAGLTQAEIDARDNLRYALAAPAGTYSVRYETVGSGYRIPMERDPMRQPEREWFK